MWQDERYLNAFLYSHPYTSPSGSSWDEKGVEQNTDAHIGAKKLSSFSYEIPQKIDISLPLPQIFSRSLVDESRVVECCFWRSRKTVVSALVLAKDEEKEWLGPQQKKQLRKWKKGRNGILGVILCFGGVPLPSLVSHLLEPTLCFPFPVSYMFFFCPGWGRVCWRNIYWIDRTVSHVNNRKNSHWSRCLSKPRPKVSQAGKDK